MERVNASPVLERRYERLKSEWGEHGPSHNINYRVMAATRTVILKNHTGYVSLNSAEQQKKRTFT